MRSRFPCLIFQSIRQLGFLSFSLLIASITFAQPPGGPGGPDSSDIDLVDEFDTDKDGILNAYERKLARNSLQNRTAGRSSGGPGGGGPRGGPGGRSRGGGSRPSGSAGPRVDPSRVASYSSNEGLYDTDVLRTIFLEFEAKDWEQELADFKPTDVEVPATMIVDGKTYPQVGVSFRGASSFFMIPDGSKRSLNLSMDFVDEDQRLYGYKTLNLLNCNGDASMMSSLLYQDIANKKMAAPKVNFVKVVINGRSWGVYANAQQFNKDFLKENYDSKKGARWKVTGSPHGDGGLRYMGDDVQEYRDRYEIKSKDKPESWKDLIELCRVLDETPAKDLETALAPILDVDGALWFLAVDVALINSDGYWTRASDYSIYQNEDGVFHVLPHDMNESFRASRGGGGPGGFRGGPNRSRGGGPGGQRGPGFGFGGPPGGEFGQRGGDRGRGGGPDVTRGGAGGFEIDPLIGLDDARFALRSKLLANENLRRRYLQYVRMIAEEYLDWNYLGKKVAAARELIVDEVKADTRKLMSDKDFLAATDDKKGALREFCDKRSEYLLSLPAIKALPAD